MTTPTSNLCLEDYLCINLTHASHNPHITGDKDAEFLIVSPYDERDHQLDLSTVDTGCQLLAKVLVSMSSSREDYATAPYAEIFNFGELADSLRELVTESNFKWTEKDFYVVVFRSQIPQTTVYSDLGNLDKAAHAEAMQSGGFLKYWFGSPNKDGRNLATCVWRFPEDAVAGSRGERHRIAVGATRLLYSEWGIERLRLRITDGAKEWKISAWSE